MVMTLKHFSSIKESLIFQRIHIIFSKENEESKQLWPKILPVPPPEGMLQIPGLYFHNTFPYIELNLF